jgi:AraC-like DNA-binding protein
VLFNPDEPHSADQVGRETWDYCAVYVSRASLESWLPAHGAGVRLGGVVGHAPALAAELTSICHRLGDDPESARVETRFARFVRAIFAEFGDSTPHDEYAGESDSVWAVREYLDACHARPIRLEELAAISGTSTFALIRSFSRAFGMPPYRYLTNLRIARAQELLRLGRPISDTAFSTGFSDQAHFTRFFRRIVGVPPGVWARGWGASMFVGLGRRAMSETDDPRQLPSGGVELPHHGEHRESSQTFRGHRPCVRRSGAHRAR